MKYYNQKKINPTLIGLFVFLVRLGRALLSLPRYFFPRGRPVILVIDGFLIGDAVLLRPLIKSIIDVFGKTHSIVVISGEHGEQIYSDLISDLKIINFKFPWASYDYSFHSLCKLFFLWFRLYTTNVHCAIETRGDVRNIAWISLACPTSLIGFGFTGGADLLTKIVKDSEKIEHVFDHVIRLGGALGIEVSEKAIKNLLIKMAKRENLPRIGVSFAGSQPLKCLPLNVGLSLLKSLSEQFDAEIIYIKAPQDNRYTEDLINEELSGCVRYFSGCFGGYLELLQSLDCYIGMDSAGGHICAMYDIPSIIIFGTQEASYCSPVGGHPLLCIESLQRLPCRPCDGVICTNSVYQACLQHIDLNRINYFIRRCLSVAK